ncbi:MAG: hypothetical protein M1148_04010 [Candidatus Thermoplasmatota archaeon]|nr:hypothetical protein [Candidatus Thermoplasmatota archaeon]
MKEVLLNFEEFMDRRNSCSERFPVHYSFRREDWFPFTSITFRVQFLEELTERIIIFEKHTVVPSFEEDKIKAFRDTCMVDAQNAGATPGYFEDGGDGQ